MDIPGPNRTYLALNMQTLFLHLGFSGSFEKYLQTCTSQNIWFSLTFQENWTHILRYKHLFCNRRSPHLHRPSNPIWLLRPRHIQSEDYSSKVESYLIPREWNRRVWWIRFAEDQAACIRYEEVIHSIPCDGQAACWKPYHLNPCKVRSERGLWKDFH